MLPFYFYYRMFPNVPPPLRARIYESKYNDRQEDFIRISESQICEIYQSMQLFFYTVLECLVTVRVVGIPRFERRIEENRPR